MGMTLLVLVAQFYANVKMVRKIDTRCGDDQEQRFQLFAHASQVRCSPRPSLPVLPSTRPEWPRMRPAAQGRAKREQRHDAKHGVKHTEREIENECSVQRTRRRDIYI